MSATLQNLGQLDEAEPLLRRAITITEKTRGKNHPELATHLNNLGTLLQLSGKLGEAEQLLERAVSVLTDHHSHRHFKVARENLAAVRRARTK